MTKGKIMVCVWAARVPGMSAWQWALRPDNKATLWMALSFCVQFGDL